MLGPLVVMLVKGKVSEFISDQSREALNFQITMLIAFIVSSFLILVLIGLVFIIIVGIADIILTIVAAVSASQGTRYRYPFTLRLIK